MPDTDTIPIVDDEIALAALRVDVLPDAGRHWRVDLAAERWPSRTG